MDTEYILDCAFELSETTAVENAVLCSHKGAYWTVRDFVDHDRHMPDHFLQNTARERLTSASLPEQYFFALCGMNGLQFSLKAFAERAAHLVQLKAQEDLDIDRPLLRGLYPERDQLPAVRLVNREADISEGLVRHMLDQMCTPLAQRWSQDLRLMTEAAQWHQADGGHAFGQMLLADNFTQAHLVDVSDLARKALQSRTRQLARLQREEQGLRSKAKAAIKKATRLFEGLGKADSLKLFVSGSEVYLSHPQSAFKFILKPLQVSGWLLDRTIAGRTHTPYELQLLTKDDVYLAKLCVYFKDTPVLDQLLALTLFIESGDELKVLEKANWFAMENWTPAKTDRVLQAYPQLESKMPRRREDDSKNRSLTLVDAGFLRKQAHWEPFKGRVEQWVATWMEPAVKTSQHLVHTLPDVARQVQDAERLRRQLDSQARQAALAAARNSQVALAA